MTTGIYCLQFNGTDKVYIGQSVNIERRYQQHKRTFIRKEATKKLQEAYQEFGAPELKILLVCQSTSLDLYEDIFISYYNSYTNGFNSYPTANWAPVLKGPNSGNAKYTKEQILLVFDILYNCEDIPYIEVANFTKVSSSVVASIATGKIHCWLSDLYPEKTKLLLSNIGKRSRALTTVSEALSAKSMGITYPKIKDPNGTVYTVNNAYKFAREHGLAGNHLQEVLNGHRKSHKGWKIWEAQEQV